MVYPSNQLQTHSRIKLSSTGSRNELCYLLDNLNQTGIKHKEIMAEKYLVNCACIFGGQRNQSLVSKIALMVMILTPFIFSACSINEDGRGSSQPAYVEVSESKEIKVEISNIVNVLGALSPDGHGIKLFLSITGETDPEYIAESGKEKWASEPTRAEVFIAAVKEYERLSKTKIFADDAEIAVYADRFKTIGTFGVPFSALRNWLDMTQTEQDDFIGNIENPESGIPLEQVYFTGEFKDDVGKDSVKYSEFQIWMNAISNCSNANLTSGMKETGEGISLIMDKDIPYVDVKSVLYNLNDINLNKFTVIISCRKD